MPAKDKHNIMYLLLRICAESLESLSNNTCINIFFENITVEIIGGIYVIILIDLIIEVIPRSYFVSRLVYGI